MLIHRQKPAPQPWRWPEGKPKPVLPVIRLPIFRVHYKAMEAFLANVYRMDDFDFLRAAGVTHGVVPEYRVTGEMPLSWDSQNRAEQVRRGRRTKDILLILNVLCHDGFIEAGSYLIDTAKPVPPIQQYRELLKQTGNPLDPKCVKFRAQYRGDADFAAKAAILDNAVLEWRRSLDKA